MPAHRSARKREEHASPKAKATAAVVLEGLTGLRSAPEAARALGVTLVRYYAVEAHAVAGLLAACEPAAPGPAPARTAERELERLRRECRLKEQELSRLRAVLRTTQRSLGVQPVAGPPSAPTPGTGTSKGSGKHRRPRRPVVRALTVVRRLLAATPGTPPGTGTTESDIAGKVSTPPAAASTPSGGPGGG